MSERTFENLVFVTTAEGLTPDISCLEDACHFRDKWPGHRHRAMDETAVQARRQAFDGQVPMKKAQVAFAGFARSAKSLQNISTAMLRMTWAKAGETGGVAA
ncbi:DUF982 domain-containing protein [Mesorhizobium sp. 1M-11]|uniref:DUF982 domain-containing protein n=1 Tax=Mesorhizobium sp. 1M-11 TaxID=1529006 RepID=UPI0006C7680F|nr:DUF982 domain-containing protein [Mesorhizobium sp. 1M-11]